MALVLAVGVGVAAIPVPLGAEREGDNLLQATDPWSWYSRGLPWQGPEAGWKAGEQIPDLLDGTSWKVPARRKAVRPTHDLGTPDLEPTGAECSSSRVPLAAISPRSLFGDSQVVLVPPFSGVRLEARLTDREMLDPLEVLCTRNTHGAWVPAWIGDVPNVPVVNYAVHPSTLNPQPSTLNLQPSTLNPQPSALNPQPSTLHPQPSTLNPQHPTLKPRIPA